MEIQRVITHKSPHLDEIAGLWLLQEFGKESYPGITRAKVEFCEDDNYPKDDNILLLGIGRGKFGGHHGANGECVAISVAKDLGLDQELGLGPILKFIDNIDKNANAHPFDISSVIKDMHLQYPDCPDMVINWVLLALNAKFGAQAEFLDASGDLEKAVVEELRIKGEAITLVVAESDNKQFPKFARSQMGANADVIVQRNSTGNVQIFADHKIDIDIESVVPIVRVEEQRIKKKFPVTDWNELRSDGVLPEIPEWFYHREGRMLLNSSLTRPGIPATKISLEKIAEFVRIGIDPDYFPDECRGWCIKHDCSFYAYGLKQCRSLRRRVYEKTNKRL